ncbi:FAD-dependent oxidoreductase [Corynebacterium sp. 320]|uniref:FAD-dependent oxidoreductase n=1 Tax=Corynebacterium TaxID=1716 RepID=UPI00125CCFE2|nr:MULTISPECIES: FAD-dependent oxidoreductase [Corynebacterium]KAB1503959.1 FAD-dependent oxidoreductase [Corynebacterium sp. 320]KAB1552942.1 FAD-dependent oxidoreductase [Corynebacterium sp. 321]KAB1553838.1 FAD-dependent oxidoreductase [Corynebacterium sp. 319]KAB3528095.1 FAD-dependent oxidoreductase [Corynebacterium sp. 250]KAB3540417.1 FAD-dependent oxidoreductase [Corynebacterium sp. 366]
MTDIAIIGGGVAGLAAARTLRTKGYRCDIYESTGELGGRVRSEYFDDITVDYGFQWFNSWYPSLKEILGSGEYETLDVCNFKPGIQTLTDSGMAMFADPIRAPRLVPALMRSHVRSAMTFKEFMRLQRWIGSEIPHRSSLEVRSIRDAKAACDVSVAESLDHRGVTGRMRTCVVDPVIEAFMVDKEGRSSATFAKWMIGTLLRGTFAVPRLGMGELTSIMARVHGMVTHLNAHITGLTILDNGVRVSVDGAPDATYRKVILALQPSEERSLLESIGWLQPPLESVGCSTWWFVSDEPIDDNGLITVDGCKRTPISVAAEVTSASPEYAPGRHLVAGSVVHNSPNDSISDLPTDLEMRQHLGQLFDVDSSRWDLVTRHDIAEAKPIIPPTRAVSKKGQKFCVDEKVFLAGVQYATPTLDGAIRSGQRAAQHVANALDTP